MIIYKVLRNTEFFELEERGESFGSLEDKKDGFIHLSTRDQLHSTLEKHFYLENDLILMAIDSDVIQKDLKWESAPNDQLFPHLYSNLFFDHALWYAPIPLIDKMHITPSGA